MIRSWIPLLFSVLLLLCAGAPPPARAAGESLLLPLKPVDPSFTWSSADRYGDDFAYWYGEVRKHLRDEQAMDPSTAPAESMSRMASEGGRAQIGRPFSGYVSSLLNLYRVTRHRELLDEVRRVLVLAQGNLERNQKENDHPYRMWKPVFNEGWVDAKEVSLANGFLPEAIYALYLNREQEGYSETIDWWLDYLVHDFEKQYAELTASGNLSAYKGLPNNWMMHPFTHLARYVFFMDKLAQAGALDRYRTADEQKRYGELYAEMRDILAQQFRTDTLPDGREAAVWGHGVRHVVTDPTRMGPRFLQKVPEGGSLGDISAGFQMGGYPLITMAGVIAISLEGDPILSERRFMSRISRALTESMMLYEDSPILPGSRVTVKDDRGVAAGGTVTIAMHHVFVHVGGARHGGLMPPWSRSVRIDGWTFHGGRPYSVVANRPGTPFVVGDLALVRAPALFLFAWDDSGSVDELKETRHYKLVTDLYEEGSARTNTKPTKQAAQALKLPAALAFALASKQKMPGADTPRGGPGVQKAP